MTVLFLLSISSLSVLATSSCTGVDEVSGGDASYSSYVTLTIKVITPMNEETTMYPTDTADSGNYWEEQRCSNAAAKKHRDIITSHSIDSLNSVCTYGSYNLEGDYSFKLYADGTSYCTEGSLTVDWNTREAWCNTSTCGKGDWDSSRGCCSPREMDSSFTYTNEDCSPPMTPVTYMCYYSSNPKFETPSSDAAWLDATAMDGEVVYEGCGDRNETTAEDGYEFVSTGSAWYYCNSSGFQYGSNTLSITGTDSNSNSVTHQYICVNWIAQRLYTIAECNPNSGTQGDLHDIAGYIGGIIARGGESVNLTGGYVYFCTNSSASWSTDLDDITKTGTKGTYCNNAEYPPTSYSDTLSGTSMGIKWTGSYCCGETDDWYYRYPNTTFNVYNEYYNDNDTGVLFKNTTYPGACFNNRYQTNGTFLTIYDASGTSKQVDEVMIWKGTFQGCALSHTLALSNKQSSSRTNAGYVYEDVSCPEPLTSDIHKPYEGSFNATSAADYGYTGYTYSNDFLLNLLDKPNPGGGGTSLGSLIKDNEYCNVKNLTSSASYFCSYTEKWLSQTATSPRTHLSFVPWNDSSLQQAECCQPTECWNGSSCVSSILSTKVTSPLMTMNSRGDGFVCMEGRWQWTYKKTNWDGSETGYCYNNTQCLVSSSGSTNYSNVYSPIRYPSDVIGTIDSPMCINNEEFYLDHYCENGTWTTRTKALALELRSIAGTSDFSLYCDSYDHVLNRYDYMLPSDSLTIGSKYFVAASGSKCVSYRNTQVPCANHVCVLTINPTSTSPTMYFGTSINYRLNRTTSSGGTGGTLGYDVGSAFGTTLIGSTCTSYQGTTDEFKQCASNVYFNGKRSIIIFTKSTAPGIVSYISVLQTMFSNIISTLVSWIASDAEAATEGYDYSLFHTMADDLFNATTNEAYHIPNFECQNCTGTLGTNDRTGICGEHANPRKIYDFSSIYMSRVGNRAIFGMGELEADSDLTALRMYGLLFANFTEDICSTFRSSITGYLCEKSGNSYVIRVSNPATSIDTSYSSLFDIYTGEQWVYMAPSTRVQS